MNKINVMILSNLKAVFLIGMPGGSEWIFILLAVVLLFGGKKIPELMKGIGKGVRDFNDAKTSVKNEIEEGMKEKDKEQEIRELKQQLEVKRSQDAQVQELKQQLEQKSPIAEVHSQELPK